MFHQIGRAAYWGWQQAARAWGGTPGLKDIIASHHLTVFGENHRDENRFSQYERIFKAAAAAGVFDALVEAPPCSQGDYDLRVDELKRESPRCLDELFIKIQTDQELDQGQKLLEAYCILSAKYGVRLHCQDIGGRKQSDVYNYMLILLEFFNITEKRGTLSKSDRGLRAGLKKYASPQEAVNDMTERDWKKLFDRFLWIHEDQLRGILGETPSPEIIRDCFRLSDPEVRRKAWIHRLTEGDRLTAQAMDKKMKDKPWFAILGMLHGRYAGAEAPTDGAISFNSVAKGPDGKSRVVRIQISPGKNFDPENKLALNPPDFYLSPEGRLTKEYPYSDNPTPPPRASAGILRHFWRRNLGSILSKSL